MMGSTALMHSSFDSNKMHYAFGVVYPVKRHRGHPVPVALEVDVASLLVDAHGKVRIVHPQSCLHCCLPIKSKRQYGMHNAPFQGQINQFISTETKRLASCQGCDEAIVIAPKE